MQQIRTQPAGPKAFRLYSMVRDTYRHDLGERACAVYAALTYYVDPKTLQGTIPLKLLAQTDCQALSPSPVAAGLDHHYTTMGCLWMCTAGKPVCLTCAPPHTHAATACTDAQRHDARTQTSYVTLDTPEVSRAP